MKGRRAIQPDIRIDQDFLREVEIYVPDIEYRTCFYSSQDSGEPWWPSKYYKCTFGLKSGYQQVREVLKIINHSWSPWRSTKSSCVASRVWWTRTTPGRRPGWVHSPFPTQGIGSTAPPSNLLASTCAPQSLFWQSSTGWGCQSTMPRVSAQPASVSATSWVTTPYSWVNENWDFLAENYVFLEYFLTRNM